MRRFGRNLLCLTPVFLFLFHSILMAGPGQNSSDPRILWAFGAIRAASNPPKVEPVTAGMVLSSGDKLKMMIQIRKKCFVYLIHRDSEGNFSMLFPYNLKQFDTDYQIARNYYAPKGEAWFQLDNRTGSETFYLIASDQRLLDIEYTYEQYASSKDSRKQDLAGQMISELDGITEKYLASSKGVETGAADRPLVRGFERATGADQTEIAGLAREISFDHIHSESFIIDHR
ncbi:conserved exported hypothetical protein [Syntrophobacter sp. SbD1]|nr:conserved exported hypothetical protein [Syntrophobacter sp. SbD1]